MYTHFIFLFFFVPKKCLFIHFPEIIVGIAEVTQIIFKNYCQETEKREENEKTAKFFFCSCDLTIREFVFYVRIFFVLFQLLRLEIWNEYVHKSEHIKARCEYVKGMLDTGNGL